MEKGNNCSLLNPNLNNKARTFSSSVPAPQNQENKGMPLKKKDHLKIGQNCIVVKGQWKGYEGKIKDADEKGVTIELLAKAKHLNLGWEFVNSKDGNLEYEAGDDGKTVSDSCNIIFFSFLLKLNFF